VYGCGQVRLVSVTAAPIIGTLFFNGSRSFELFEGIDTLEFQIAVVAQQLMYSDYA
jgi:hypothetical protein